MIAENAKIRNRFLAKVSRLCDSLEIQTRKQEAPYINVARKEYLLKSFRDRVESFYGSLSDSYREELKKHIVFKKVNDLLIKGKLSPIE